MPDEFGGTEVDEPQMDDFGGVAIDDSNRADIPLLDESSRLLPDMQATTRGAPQHQWHPGELKAALAEVYTAPIRDLAGIIPRPTGRIGALLRTGTGFEKAIAGGAEGTAELIEGVANYLQSPQG